MVTLRKFNSSPLKLDTTIFSPLVCPLRCPNWWPGLRAKLSAHRPARHDSNPIALRPDNDEQHKGVGKVVTCCWSFENPANQLRLVVYPIVYTFFYIPLAVDFYSTLWKDKTFNFLRDYCTNVAGIQSYFANIFRCFGYVILADMS